MNVKNNDFSPGDRTWAFHAIPITDIQGTRNDQRVGRQVFLHGIRFTMQIQTTIAPTLDSWTNGHIHFALIQALDDEITSTNQKPTFSAPIGDPNLDPRSTIPIDDSLVSRMDIATAKLKNDEYRVITHRKYFAGKVSQLANQAVCSTRQFYIPIKKMVQFRTSSDVTGTKPFHIMVWFVPSSNYSGETVDRFIRVNMRHATYFKLSTQ